MDRSGPSARGAHAAARARRPRLLLRCALSGTLVRVSLCVCAPGAMADSAARIAEIKQALTSTGKSVSAYSQKCGASTGKLAAAEAATGPLACQFALR